MTSVDRACWYAADASVSYALLGWAGLGGGLGLFLREKIKLSPPGRGTGKVLTKEWIWTSDRDCPQTAALYLQLQ